MRLDDFPDSTVVPRLRVLIVGPLPPPVGGVETVVKAVLDSEAFSDFEIAHCNTTKRRSKDTQGKFDFGNFLWAAIHFLRMAKSLVSFRPEVVYMPVTASWSGFWRDAVLAWMAKRARARLIGHFHGGWIDRILAARGIGGSLVGASLAQFDALLVLGKKWEQLMVDYGYRGNVAVVPGFPSRELMITAAKFIRRYEANDPVGLFVGHIGPMKGVPDLLMALYRLKKAGRPVKFVVVGPPQMAGDAQKIAAQHAELGLEDVVTFVGPLEGEALWQQFRDAAYFVLPSYVEGLPIVFMEAGAFGLPVIGTPVGVIPDLLEHGRNGLLVQPGDVEGLAAGIDLLAHSGKERERLGRALRKDVARYHPDILCVNIANVVRDAEPLRRSYAR